MRILAAVLFLPALLATRLPAQEHGAIQGRVTDRSGAPVAGALIRIEPSSAGTVTGLDGRYLVPRVRVGLVRVEAMRLGYRTAGQSVEVRPGQPTEAGLVLEHGLFEGGFSRLVPRLIPPGPDTLSRHEGLPATMSQLLAGRSPSVIVRASSGTLGTGSRVYLRGLSSVNYRATPLVVVDGVRYVSEPGALQVPVGGQSPSRLDDLDPEEIERVVVLPGPAAAARYGPEGANGVLEVTTRRGPSAGLRVGGFAEAGMRADGARSPFAWSRVGEDSENGRTIYCTLTQEVLEQCVPYPDSVRFTRNPTALREGGHRRARVVAEGGGRWGRLRGTADLGATDGVRAHEQWERRRLHLAGVLQPLRTLEVDASVLHLDADLDLPQGDDSNLGYQYPLVAFGPGDQRRQADWVPPVSQHARHTTGGVGVRWSALDWLAVHARGGLDRAIRDDRWVLRPPTPSDSARSEGDESWTRRTAGVGATGTGRVGGFVSTSSLEVERWSERRGEQLFTRDRIVEQETERFQRASAVAVALSQRVEGPRLGGAAHLRRDQVQPDDRGLWSGSVSAYGVPLARRLGPLDGLRLRAGYGWVARAQPRDFVPGCFLQQGCTRIPDGARTRELEGGLDLRAAGDRATLAVTAYRRTTEEPIWALGTNEGSYTIRNSGMEAALRVSLPERAGVRPVVEVLGWTNRNRVVELDGPPIAFNLFNQTIREGLPLGAWYGRPIRSVHDADGNGIITGVCPGSQACEVQLDTARFLGRALPDHGVTVGLRLQAGDRVTLSARVEHQGGNRLLNRTALYQCAALLTCRAALDPSASLEDQGRVQAARRGSPAGFLEDGAFTRLREVALTVAAPAALLRVSGAQAMHLVLAGRNLATWTDYSGMDPEVNFTGSGDPISSGEWLTQPNPRVWTVRLEVNP